MHTEVEGKRFVTSKMSRWRQTVRCVGLGLVVGLAAAGAGCTGRLVSHAVENEIEACLPNLIGPAQSYKVEVHGPAGKMLRGRIRQLVVYGKGVWAMPDLCLDALEVRMKDVVADPGSMALESIGEVAFETTILEKSLNEHLAHSRADGLRVELLDGRVIALARPKVLGIPTNVRLTGSLAAREDKLDFLVDRFEVAGINTPSVAAKILEDRINPVISLKLAGFSLELTSAKVMPGAVRITGTAHPSGKTWEARNNNRK